MSAWTDAVAALGASVLSWHRQGEASGTTMVDSSGNSRDGTYGDPPTLGQPGLIVDDATTSASYAAGGDYAIVNYGSWMNVTPLTVIVWAKPINGVNRFLITRDEGGTGFAFYVNNSFLYFHRRSPFVSLQDATTNVVDDGLAHMLTFVHDGTQIRLNVDGVDVASTSDANALPGGTNRFLIGGNNVGANLGGPMQELLYISDALTEAELAALYAAGLGEEPPAYVPLVEDFEGGTDGATITTANTGFNGIGLTEAPVLTSDARFTSAQKHSGDLSMTCNPGAGFEVEQLEYPYVHEPISVAPLEDFYWYRQDWDNTTGSPSSFSILDAFVGTAGADRIDDATLYLFELYFDCDTGQYRFGIDEFNFEDGFTAPDATWLKVAWTYDGVDQFTLDVTDDAETSYFSDSFTLTACAGKQLGYYNFFVQASDRLTSWVDDINVASAPCPTGYEVRVDGGESIDVGTDLSYLFEGLDEGTAYTFEVRSYGEDGFSSWVGVEASTLVCSTAIVAVGFPETAIQVKKPDGSWVPVQAVIQQ